ncbi:hypothetical protein JWG42_15040 [Desulfoprunum benzoelyticum]|uniref:Uncharacterized protein n=1 Tax=Desulfoprunum benzoelyticum TaxID=1506996 RepID=A0A840V959_9BACT|nr:hypothetical protein [Desulfoprunum benzoelyticum]MBB5349461.1 hypothetical protein [Desulfoprunum benzoelyticum]MBM9531474.1 hypothetical protein [Desulfoprunum benzoelyticum]
MEWNVEGVVFLHPPDAYTGTFDNAKMQARHERQMQDKLAQLKDTLQRQADPLKAMKLLHVKDQPQFFRNNLGQFRQAGRLEEAVLFLYGRFNSPFSSGGDAETWNDLFADCDPERLYALGEPVGFASATVYRGSVAGVRTSLSWTPDRRRAEGFAERWKDPSLGGGELFEVDVVKADIMVYLRHRHEDEVLLKPAFIASAEIRPFRSKGM